MNDLKQWTESILMGNKLKVIPIMTYPGIELCGRTIKEADTLGISFSGKTI